MKTVMVLFFSVMTLAVYSQSVTARTNEFEIDFSDPKKLVTSTVPSINWITPVPETNYVQENKFKIKFEVVSTSGLKNVTLSVKENIETSSRGSQTIMPEETEKFRLVVEKTLTLLDGDNIVEVVAENSEGVRTVSARKVVIGSVSLADASNLNRTDYALMFATDKYDNWSDLVNPIFDSRTIADELKKTYGFKVELLENPSQIEIFKKLREYAEKKYQPLDQLFIFFAGHGSYDQTFGEGYVVTKESLLNDEAKVSFVSHNRLRSNINNIPCEHVFLAMDVCFGGTFDQALASSRGADEVYKEQSQAEFLTRKLTYKTRRFLTSGGKTYVSDGIPGMHSPFAKGFLEGLRSNGGRDRILTLPELITYVEKLKTPPRFGEFGDNAPGSDFLFVVK
jgi:hypothetical protein